MPQTNKCNNLSCTLLKSIVNFAINNLWFNICIFGTNLIYTSNPLNEWWTPTDIGSTELFDTSSYINPYRADISQFTRYISGYLSKLSSTTFIKTQSFEECMELCIKDKNCKVQYYNNYIFNYIIYMFHISLLFNFNT